MELEAVQGILSKVESKSIKAAKDCSTVESQLKDTQVQLGHALLCTCLLLTSMVDFQIADCFTSIAETFFVVLKSYFIFSLWLGITGGGD